MQREWGAAKGEDGWINRGPDSGPSSAQGASCPDRPSQSMMLIPENSSKRKSGMI